MGSPDPLGSAADRHSGSTLEAGGMDLHRRQPRRKLIGSRRWIRPPATIMTPPGPLCPKYDANDWQWSPIGAQASHNRVGSRERAPPHFAREETAQFVTFRLADYPSPRSQPERHYRIMEILYRSTGKPIAGQLGSVLAGRLLRPRD